MRGLPGWDDLARNVRFAARLFVRNPAFSAAVVLTLGLCIGANTAVYSVVDAILLRPLPFPEPDRLVQVVTVFSTKGMSGEQSSQTGAVWEGVRDHAPSLAAAVSAGMVVNVNLAGEGRVESVRQHRVSAGFFHALGVNPLVGREFTRDEDRPGGPPVVLLSHAVWQRLFDGDRRLVGQTVRLRGEAYTVVGVMPDGFTSIQPADVWTPARPSTQGEGGGSNYLVFGRVQPGVSRLQAEAEVGRLGQDLFRNMDIPPGSTARLHLVPLQQGLTEDVRRPIILLWGGVLAVLLIGCANVASLLLARASARTREIATRVALGGGRAAVVGQLLTESLFLAIAGGIAGLVIGKAILWALGRDVASAFDVWQPIGLDARVMAVTLVLSALTSLAFGLLPAFRAARVDVRQALIESGGRGIAGASRQWPRRILVVMQVALGLALVVGAGLLTRTALGLYLQPPGFDSRHVVTGQVSLEDARYRTTANVTRFFDGALLRIRALPGVESAGVALTLPYERALNLGIRILDGRSGTKVSSVVYVTPGFFRTLRVATLRGREIEERDQAGAPPVAAVNEAFARWFFKRRDVLGERIAVAGGPREIVGVMGDVQQRSGWGDFGPLAAIPTIYVPAAQMPDAAMPLVHTWFSPSIVVRSAVAPSALLGPIQRVVAAVDPLLPLNSFRSMDQVRAESLSGQRARAELLGGMAMLALALTFVGLYGLVASGVAERLHELGIRLALGATRRQALFTVGSQGMILALTGIACGALLAVMGVPLLRGLVWGVPLFDPWTFGGAAAGILVLAAAASLLPALRATRVDPARILRGQ